MSEIDRDTLRRCQAGEAAAQRALVACYQRPVFALLSRLLGHGPHVEDLAQETFLRVFRAIGSFDPAGPARLSTWVLTIATRLALDARKRRRLDPAPLDEAANEAADADPERDAERARLGRAIAEAARDLSDDQRAAFLLLEFHGFSVAEAAQSLQIPENTVKQRVFRAREKLRSRLAALWSGGSP